MSQRKCVSAQLLYAEIVGAAKGMRRVTKMARETT
jgi:hypothetical protein